ncbi:MAG: type II toxin-antitoxin system Phd/YefM family antitoxin [Terriglobales bacterium]
MTMGLREANQQFSKIVRAVRRGETVLLTDRGKPLAEVKPVRRRTRKAAGGLGPELESRLNAMAAEGLLIRATRPGPMDLRGWKPIKLRGGKSASQTVIEDRADRT